MPKIQEYQSQTNAAQVVQGRRFTGAETDISSGLASFGQGMTAVADMQMKRQEQDELSKTAARLSEIQAKRALGLQEKIKSAGEDASDEMIDEFLQDYDNEISELSSGLKTRAGQLHVRNQSAELRTNLMQNGVAGLAVKKAEIRVTQLQTAIDQGSAAVINDPSSFQSTLKMQVSNIDALVQSGGIDSAVGEKLKVKLSRDLAVSAVRGWNELDPEGTKDRLKKGEFDAHLDGDAKRQLFGEADQEIRARRMDQELMMQKQERAKREAQQRTQNEFVAKFVDNTLSARDIVASNLEPETKRTYLNWIDEGRKGPPKTDGTVFTTLFQRIHADDADPNKIFDENDLNQYVGNGLGFEDFQRLRGELQGKGSAEGKAIADMRKSVMTIAKGQLTKSQIGLPDPEGDKQLASFQAFMIDEFSKQRKAGVSARALLTPGTKEYLGNYIQNYRRDMKDIMASKREAFMPRRTPAPNAAPGLSMTNDQTAQGPLPTATPGKPALVRQPGESPAAFLKRKKEAGQ